MLLTILFLIAGLLQRLRTAGQPPDTFTRFGLPLKTLKVTSAFGYRVNPLSGRPEFHAGIDLAANGDTVFCILDGTVARAGCDPLSGNYLLIDHGCGLQSLYAHLSAIAVLPGDSVRRAMPLGLSGSTGLVTGAHLHFAIKFNGRPVSPLAFLYGLLARPP